MFDLFIIYRLLKIIIQAHQRAGSAQERQETNGSRESERIFPFPASLLDCVTTASRVVLDSGNPPASAS